LLKILFGLLSGIFALLSALFKYLDISEQRRNDKFKNWFENKWYLLSKSKWLLLPERTIIILLELKEIVASLLYRKLFQRIQESNKISYIAAAIFVVLIIISYFIYLGIIFLIIFAGLYGYYFISQILISYNEKYIPLNHLKKIINVIYLKYQRVVEYTYTIITLFLFIVIPALILLDKILDLDFYIALFITLFLFPFFILIFISSLFVSFNNPLIKKNNLYYSMMGAALVFSFNITFISLLIGHLTDPIAWLPQTLQMFISNIFFDGLTIAFTFFILGWAVTASPIIRIPLAIFYDIIFSALFAICSLYFGLLLTDKQLSVGQIFNILIAISADGNSIEVGPYFWVMHTTFIPTFIYLFTILYFYLNKMILVFLEIFFNKARIHEKPLKLTSALCTVISVVFGFIFISMGFIVEYFDKSSNINGKYK